MWLIKGTYQGKTQVLDCYESLTLAIKMRKQFSQDYGINWTITINKKV